MLLIDHYGYSLALIRCVRSHVCILLPNKESGEMLHNDYLSVLIIIIAEFSLILNQV